MDRGDRLALMGIGSGINVVMLGVDWQTTLSATADADPRLSTPDRLVNRSHLAPQGAHSGYERSVSAGRTTRRTTFSALG